jgi:hypothetical protein
VKRRRRAAVAGFLALAIAACLAACGTSTAGSTAAASGAGPMGNSTGTTGPGSGQSGDPGAAPSAKPSAVPRGTPTARASGRPAGPDADPDHTLDAPGGFWSGTDSWPVPISGNAPYKTVSVGGRYGGYVGMAGNWARWQGCTTGNFLAWSGTNSQQANTNYTRYGAGIGTGLYWYMGGPGVDPRWNGTTAEAGTWGAEQAAQAIAAAARDHVTYPVLFMDIEMPGIKPAVDNGWQDVYTSPCSGEVRSGQHVTPALARAEFNGFAQYLTAHSRYKAGVYSDSGIWQQVFGTGSAGYIPHTYEWTYEPETADLRAAPRGWCLTGASGDCAQFFGGVSPSSPYAIMWQWSGGGGVSNSIGDFDQIDTGTIR